MHAMYVLAAFGVLISINVIVNTVACPACEHSWFLYELANINTSFKIPHLHCILQG